MSDHIIKLIPTDPFFRIDQTKASRLGKYLAAHTTAESIKIRLRSRPQFVDCGGNLDRIFCPVCGHILDMDWWTDALDAKYQDGFRSLEVTLPCCGAQRSLNDLQYYFPCGFACVEFELWNPQEEPDRACRRELGKRLGVPVRMIYCHL